MYLLHNNVKAQRQGKLKLKCSLTYILNDQKNKLKNPRQLVQHENYTTTKTFFK